MSPNIGEPAATKQQARVGQHIADNHPLDRAHLQGKRRRDRWKRNVEGAIERSEKGAQAGNDNGTGQDR